MISATLNLQMRSTDMAAWIMSTCWRPKNRRVVAVSTYTGTEVGSFTQNRQHVCFDPFTINTLSIARTPHFREKYKEMAWIVTCSLRAWTQSLLQKSGASTHAMIERVHLESWHTRLLHSYTVIPRGEGWTTGNSSYYYYLVCNFRLDMAGEWQATVAIVPLKRKEPFRVLRKHKTSHV